MSANDYRVAIPLDNAWLCLDCECLVNSGDSCIACASKALVPVASFLAPRDPAPVRAIVLGEYV